jgi:hypothetical protein
VRLGKDHRVVTHTVHLPRLLNHLPHPELTLLEECLACIRSNLGSFDPLARFLDLRPQVGPQLIVFLLLIEYDEQEVLVALVQSAKDILAEINREQVIRLYQLPQLVLIDEQVLVFFLSGKQFDKCLKQENLAHHPQVVQLVEL